MRCWRRLARGSARSFCCCNGHNGYRVSGVAGRGGGVAHRRIGNFAAAPGEHDRARALQKVEEPRFGWMVALHTAVLVGAGAEVVFLHRPFIPLLAAVMFAIFLAANVVRWWVIRTLGEHWNVQVMDSTRLGVIVSGPFRFVRHPNYAAVFAEMLALPLIHTAWITALAGSIGARGRAGAEALDGRASFVCRS